MISTAKMAAIQTLSTDDDLDVAWTQVVKSFEEEAQFKADRGRKLAIGDVLATIQPKGTTQSTKEKAKSVVQTILVCVQRFGDVVVTATSAVFPPSQQCFNALNFVIKATQDYHKLFEDLTTLLERVSVFLETLRTYLDQDGVNTKLDKRLRPNVYRVLEHFIVILTLTVRLTSRKNKIKAFAKVLLFSDDSGITEALATLETRVSDVVRIQVAVIGQDLSETARNIRELKGDIDLVLAYDTRNADILSKIEARDVTKESDKTIRSCLALDTFDLGMDRLTTLNEQRVWDTGTWLFGNDDSFTQWCDPAQLSSAMVLLSGKPQSGKSFLTSAIIEHLQERISRLEGDTRAFLAYHFATSTSTNDDHNLFLLNRAVRSVIWQLATKDAYFHKFVHDICEQKPALHDWHQVWMTFLCNYKPPRRTVLFIVVDGTENILFQNVRGMPPFAMLVPMITLHNADNDRFHLRLFMTAPQIDRTNDSLPENLRMHCIISLGTGPDQTKQVANISDVQQVIRARLRDTPMFRSYYKVSDRQPYQQVLNALSRNVQNDFHRLDLIFQELDHCLSIRQFNDILDKINEPIELKMRRQVETLNQTLTQDEIQEVNAVMVCIESFAFEDANADTQLVTEFVDFALQATRLVPLPTLISDRYDSLFEINALGSICWKFDGLKTYLSEQFEDERTISRINAKRGSRNTGLDLEEMDLLEKIVHTNFTNVFGVHGSVLFEKYGFDEFFRSKRGIHKATISFDEKSSRISAMSIALKVLCEPLEFLECDRLRNIARKHLGQLIYTADKSVATSDEAKAISRWIVTLLHNDRVIDEWSTNAEWSGSILLCFDSTEYREAFEIWLEGPEPINALHDRAEKDWLRDCDGDVWSYAIDRIVSSWVKRKNDSYSLIVGLLRTCGSFVSGYPCYWGERILTANQTTFVEQVSKRVPTIDRTAVIYRCVEARANTDLVDRNLNEHKAAIDACTSILSSQPDTWWALFFRAKLKMQCFRQEYQANIRDAHDDLARVTSLDLIEDDVYAKYYWSEMIPLHALCQAYLHNFAGASMTFVRMSEDDYEKDPRLSIRLGSFRYRFFDHLVDDTTSSSVRSAFQSHEKDAHKWYQWFPKLATTMRHPTDAYVLKAVACHPGALTVDDVEGPFRGAVKEDGTAHWEIQHAYADESHKASTHCSCCRALLTVMADTAWHICNDMTVRKKALAIWIQNGEHFTMVQALLETTRTVQADDRRKALALQHLKGIAATICAAPEASAITVGVPTVFLVARWMYDNEQTIEASVLRKAVLRWVGGHRKLLQGEWVTDTAAQTLPWALLSLTIDHDEIARDILEQRVDHQITEPDGRQSDISDWLVREEHGPAASVWYCKTCLIVLRPDTYVLLRQGKFLSGFCGISHDHLEVRYLRGSYGARSGPPQQDTLNREEQKYKPDLGPLQRAKAAFSWTDEDETAAARQDTDEQGKPVGWSPLPPSAKGFITPPSPTPFRMVRDEADVDPRVKQEAKQLLQDMLARMREVKVEVE